MGQLKTINEPRCYFCKRTYPLEIHHIFGKFNRKHSTEDGLCVWLCHNCHNEPPDGVHFNAERRESLCRVGQIEYEKKHTREEFMERYGRNYL